MKKQIALSLLIMSSVSWESLAVRTIFIPRPPLSDYIDSSYALACLIHNYTNKRINIAFKDESGDFLHDPDYIEPFNAIKIRFPHSVEFFIWIGNFKEQFIRSGLITSEAEFYLTQSEHEISIVRHS